MQERTNQRKKEKKKGGHWVEGRKLVQEQITSTRRRAGSTIRALPTSSAGQPGRILTNEKPIPRSAQNASISGKTLLNKISCSVLRSL
jgi:hypothetical protein